MISPGASGQHYYDRQMLPVLPWLPLPLKEFLFSIYFPGGVEEQLSLPHSWSSSLDRLELRQHRQKIKRFTEARVPQNSGS